jgi:iron complex outermembrane recepter protein
MNMMGTGGVGELSNGWAAFCLIAVLGATVSAEAQTVPAPEESGGGQLREIVVTAQKRSENLQDVPIAVTALSGESLAGKGLASTLDVAEAVPGLTFTQVIGTAAPRIRGVGTVSALAGNENSVATYVDGVYYASSGSSLLSLSDIEQVAVLKGPQGTLFGRNATGGLIQITTLDPQQQFEGRASVTYGNLDTAGGTLYVTGGITPSLAADLSIDYTNQQHGFGRDLTTGAQANESQDLTVRSKWKLDLDESTTLKLSLDFSDLDGDIPRRPTYGSHPIGGVYTGGPFDTVSNTNSLFRNEQGGGSLDVVHHFNGFDLVSLTADRHATTHAIIDADATALSLISTDDSFEDRQFTEELQLISTAQGTLQWTVGAFYFNAMGGYDPAILNLPTVAEPFTSNQYTDSLAGYGQATYRFTEGTSLTLGFRESTETRHLRASGAVIPDATGIATVTVPIAGKLSSNEPTWRVALDHHLGQDLLVYASYNRGFKSGGFNAATFYPAASSFLPEILNAYEVGIKSDLLDRHLRLNSSAFYYDYNNIQLTSYAGGNLEISNAASAKIYGLDADITAVPIDQLTLTSGLSYIHSRFGYFPNAQIGTPLATGGNALSEGNATGNEVPYTPDWTLDVGVDYRVPLPRGNLKFSTLFFHSDGFFAEPDNRLKQGPYSLLNATVTWNMDEAGRVNLSAWGKNLGNTVYATTLQTQTTSDVMVPAPGRTFGLTAGYKF